MSWRNSGLLVVFVGLSLYLQFQATNFWTATNIKVLGLDMVVTGIAAFGTALLLISGNLDVSIGSMLALVGVLATILALHINPWLAFLLAIPIGGVLGLINGVVVWRINTSPFIITLAGLIIMQSIALTITTGAPVIGVPESYQWIGQHNWFGIPISVLFLIAVYVIGWLILSGTTIGRHIYAVGGNREACTLAGISVRRICIGVFVVNGLLIGLAAFLETSRFGVGDPSGGQTLIFTAVTAAVLGGVSFYGGEGSVLGVAVAAALLTLISAAFVALNVNPYFSDAIQGILLVVVVAVDQLIHEQRERMRSAMALRDAMSRHEEATAAERRVGEFPARAADESSQ